MNAENRVRELLKQIGVDTDKVSIWKGVDLTSGRYGWHYQESGTSPHGYPTVTTHSMGLSVADVERYVDMIKAQQSQPDA